MLPCFYTLNNEKKQKIEKNITGSNFWVDRQNSYAPDPEYVKKLNQNLKSSKILLFFHGNAEDLGKAYRTLVKLRDKLKVSGSCLISYILDYHFGG